MSDNTAMVLILALLLGFASLMAWIATRRGGDDS